MKLIYYFQRLTLIKSVLMRSLDRLFLRSISNSDISVMKRCLCIYESLGKEREAEELFRKQVVAKELHGVISEASVQSHLEGLKVFLFYVALAIKWSHPEFYLLQNVINILNQTGSVQRNSELY